MIHEYSFLCWHENQNEDDALEIIATTFRLAAKKAVHKWKSTSDVEALQNQVLVFVKDESRRIHEVLVPMFEDDLGNEIETNTISP